MITPDNLRCSPNRLTISIKMYPENNQIPAPAPPPIPAMPQTPVGLSPQASSSRSGTLIAITAVLGVTTVALGIAAIVAFNQASTAKNTAEQQKKIATEAARADQKQQDQRAAEIAAETPFRSYIAPLEYGSFEIKFPKNWSATATEERAGSTQVALVFHPDFIHRSNSVDDLMAVKVQLQQKTITEFLRAYENNKKILRTDVTVSDIKGVQLTGTFPDKRLARIVAVPVRDKTLVFINESSKYSREFDEVLAQSKIRP